MFLLLLAPGIEGEDGANVCYSIGRMFRGGNIMQRVDTRGTYYLHRETSVSPSSEVRLIF